MNAILRRGSVALALALHLSGAAAADTYPSHPITLLVPYAPGGSADIVARLLAKALTDTLHESVVVDNRPGGSAVVATSALAAAKPNGYTVMLANSTHAANPAYRVLPYDTVKDFTSIAPVADVPSMLIVSTSLTVKTLDDVLALAKAKHGNLTFASVGVGTSDYLPMALLMHDAGATLTNVSYSNSGTLNTDLLSGRVPLAFITVPSGMTLVKTGKMRPLAVASMQRLPSLPDVPTIAESGLRTFHFNDWYGVLAPAHVPSDIVDKLNAAINAALRNPSLAQALSVQGASATGGTPAQLSAQIRDGIETWRAVEHR